ncbi:aminotransferase class I/II-fold pyridoxal phosphate-dependent enzyme [Periweissella fabaria]|uniref:Aminotransferase n=1 Tax=Periweissella fabaria TaxID=546157 RepID=A0ABM8Z6R4_9LACO|nr:aminotransferase class I/II-fold pyridoxal phosphate-dependent enzyme [Periweissella fabaria]MCM0596628.1 aminotransferase class I/II-fold pyridoxal phosphate-dependent enzyme [Periweissella fabaria]CAH0416447.1 putative N-acetyl-LL-diaminopimelate aminotransferase [Periweissella fabaria]
MPVITNDLLKKINPVMDQLQPGSIRAFDEQVSEIEDIIKLTLGEPDFDAPEKVKAAAIASVENNESHYAKTPGNIALREAMAAFLSRKYDLNYEPATEILVTLGATEAIQISLATILEPGDEVIIPTPTFPLYESDVISLGGVPVFVNTQPDGFVLTPERLAATLADHPTAKCLVFNYPSNPTGVTYTATQLEALANIIKQYDVFVMSDEIYSELTYTQQHVSMAQYLPEQTILISGASKAYAMTGYRIGLLAAPAALVKHITKLHQYAVTTHVNSAMAAATVAFNECDDEIAVMRDAYQTRREMLVHAFTDMGLTVASPDGAFYLFIKIPAAFGDDDFKFAVTLAQEAKVALIPGSSFGPGGQGYVRLSYAASEAKLNTAVERIRIYLEGMKKREGEQYARI